MGAIQPLQASMAYGEMSPRLYGRSNTERYRQSLQICENVFTFSHGNAVKRTGFIYLEKSPTEGNVRLFEVQQDLNNPYVIELGWRSATGGYVRVMDRSGYMYGSEIFVKNYAFQDGLEDWIDGSGSRASMTWASAGYAVFNPGNTGPSGDRIARLQQQVTVTDPLVTHALYTDLFSDSPEDVTLNIGTTQGGSEIGSFFIPAGEKYQQFTPGAGNGTFWLSFEVTDASFGSTVALDYCVIIEDTATIYEAATPWGNDELLEVTVATSTKDIALYFAHESQPPQRLTIAGPGLFTFEAVPFTNPPAAWGADDYPHAVTFFQQRLWYASSRSAPDTLWASKPTDFLDFDPGTAQPADGIEYELADRGIIEWISGGRDLLVGTDDAEYVITSSTGNLAVVPGDIEARKQSSYGSTHQDPVEVGNGVLYLGNDRRRIRFMNYQFFEEGWVSVDITWPSEHLTISGVQELHFRYAPDPLVWLVMRDGTICTAIYEREQDQMVGWHRHPLPNAHVKSAAITKNGSFTEAWIAVRREIDGGTVTYIERSDAPTFEGEPGRSQNPTRIDVRLDSGIYRPIEDVVDQDEHEITGLDHLEGQVVQAVTMKGVHVPKTVTGGKITLQFGYGTPGDQALVGLPFLGKIVTLPLEWAAGSGSAQALKKRYNRIFARIVNSAVPVINGDLPAIRNPITPMGEREPYFTGDVQVANLGWDRFAQVTIEMPEPLHYDIVAIFGEAGAGKL